MSCEASHEAGKDSKMQKRETIHWEALIQESPCTIPEWKDSKCLVTDHDFALMALH